MTTTRLALILRLQLGRETFPVINVQTVTWCGVRTEFLHLDK